VPVQATLFSRLLQHLPWSVPDRAVAAHEMDRGHRVLDARSHLVALMTGQWIEAHGLRDIEAALAAHAPALKRRRIAPACRSTLADANKMRAPVAFEAVIPALLAELSPTGQRRAKTALRLVDSTLIHPGHGAEQWAHFQNGRVAARVHVVFDPQAQVPTFHEITAGNTNGPPSGRPRPDRGTSPWPRRGCRSSPAPPPGPALPARGQAPCLRPGPRRFRLLGRSRPPGLPLRSVPARSRTALGARSPV
jgi:hypothetical protein